MEVDVCVERPPQSLHDSDRAATPIPDAGVSRPAVQEAENGSHGAPDHGAAQGVIPGQCRPRPFGADPSNVKLCVEFECTIHPVP